MKRLVVFLVVVAGLLAGLDVLARVGAERAIERAVAEEVDADTVEVELDGFPILYHLFVGEGIPEVRFGLTELLVGDPPIRLGSVDLVLKDVTVSIDELVSGAAREVTVRRGGDFEVQVSQAALQELVAREAPGWTVTLDAGSAQARGAVGDVDVEAVVDLRLEGDALVLATQEVTAGLLGLEATVAVSGLLDFRTQLPDLPYGLSFDEAQVLPGTLVLGGRVPEGAILGPPDG